MDAPNTGLMLPERHAIDEKFRKIRKLIQQLMWAIEHMPEVPVPDDEHEQPSQTSTR